MHNQYQKVEEWENWGTLLILDLFNLLFVAPYQMFFFEIQEDGMNQTFVI